MTADDVITAARQYIGVPFRHQGRGRTLDCAGLAVVVARDLGFDVQDVIGYPSNPDGTLRPALEANDCVRRVKSPQAGDVLLMRFGGDPRHVAIHAGDTIIHSYAQVGRVCEHRLSDVWRARIVAAYRFLGIE